MKLATLVIIIRDGKVLLGERKRGELGKGNLNGPGGKLDDGETPEDGIIRETREEVGIELLREKLEKAAIITFVVADEPKFECHVFKTESFKGEPQETEEMMPGWYDLSNLPFKRMHQGDFEWFERAAKGEKFRAKVYYKGMGEGLERVEFLNF